MQYFHKTACRAFINTSPCPLVHHWVCAKLLVFSSQRSRYIFVIFTRHCCPDIKFLTQISFSVWNPKRMKTLNNNNKISRIDRYVYRWNERFTNRTIFRRIVETPMPIKIGKYFWSQQHWQKTFLVIFFSLLYWKLEIMSEICGCTEIWWHTS